jgi:hypothetical protein
VISATGAALRIAASTPRRETTVKDKKVSRSFSIS